MTQRNWWKHMVALIAMHAMCCQGEWTNPKEMARRAYEIADKMDWEWRSR